jgi:hypothetical protein
MFIYLTISLSVTLSVYLSMYLSICLSIYLSISLSVCLSICLCVSLLACLSMYLSMYLSVYLSIYGSAVRVYLGRFFSFLIYTQSVGLLGRGISPSQGRYLRRTTQAQNKRTQASMPLVGFEPTIPVFERGKMVHALDRTATAIGLVFIDFK